MNRRWRICGVYGKNVWLCALFRSFPIGRPERGFFSVECTIEDANELLLYTHIALVKKHSTKKSFCACTPITCYYYSFFFSFFYASRFFRNELLKILMLNVDGRKTKRFTLRIRVIIDVRSVIYTSSLD